MEPIAARLEELAARLSPPLHFKLVGPLPPYSFVHLTSPDNSRDELYVGNYAFLQVKDQLPENAGRGGCKPAAICLIISLERSK